MKEHLSIKEFAEQKGWSISTVRRMIRAKQIKAVQRGRHCSWRIAVKEVVKFDRQNSNIT